MSSTARAIVAGHGELAAGLVSAVDQITGRGDVFVPLSNRGLSAADVDRVLRETVAASGARVLFIDLPAGSFAMAARRAQRDDPTLVIVTGVNLPMMLDFAFAEGAAAAEAARHAAEKGKAALVVAGGQGGD